VGILRVTEEGGESESEFRCDKEFGVGEARETRAHLVWKTFDDDGDDGSKLLRSEMRMLGQKLLETDERVCKSRFGVRRARRRHESSKEES